MKGFLWNRSIWIAIRKIALLKEWQGGERIDEIFNSCENDLIGFGAPELEINIRLYALAQYCTLSKNQEFLNSVASTRFFSVLNYSHFKKILRLLYSKNNSAVIVYWVVLRCALKNTLPQSYYEHIERKLQLKAYELGKLHLSAFQTHIH
ncbi:hypothetical protein AGMMS49938_15840 [Fibrobacterales bacterium]|nr:hypothetical protein AGMMS49938_15840 [Fibrobacterales bacterium]